MQTGIKLCFEHERITRQRILDLIEGLTIEQLLYIAPGFNNNLMWNYGHVAVTQHLLTFKLAQVEMQIPEEVIDRYKKGSKGAIEHTFFEQDLHFFNVNFMKLIDLTEEFYFENKLNDFHSYTTSYGATLNSIEAAVQFNNKHEALHLGYMMAQKRMLAK